MRRQMAWIVASDTTAAALPKLVMDGLPGQLSAFWERGHDATQRQLRAPACSSKHVRKGVFAAGGGTHAQSRTCSAQGDPRGSAAAAERCQQRCATVTQVALVN